MNPKTWGILILMVLLWIVLAIVSPESFLQTNNIENLLRRTAMHGLLGIAVSFVIITGGIDLSIGSLVGLSGCLLAMLLQVTYQPSAAWDVVKLDAAAKTITVRARSQGDVPKTGDSLRYFGGRRATPFVLRVTSVTEQPGGPDFSEFQIRSDVSMVEDDNTGKVVPVVPIQVKNINQATVVEMNQTVQTIRAGDRLVLLAEPGQISEQSIQRVERRTPGVTLHISGEPGRLTDMTLAFVMQRQALMPLWLGLIFVLGVGALIGLIHGLLVTKLGIQPFVVTLCGLLIYRGIARWMVSDRTMGFGTDYANSLGQLAGGRWELFNREGGGGGFGIPLIVFLLLAVAVAAGLLLNKTIWGRYIFAIGRNRDAARYAGISVDRITMLAYVLCSTLTVLGGIAFSADSNSIAPSSFGNFFELYAIAAAVLGGCSLRGGEGSILGVVAGTALMQTLYNLIVLLKISDKLEFAVIGGVILVGVIADEFIRRIASQRLKIKKA